MSNLEVEEKLDGHKKLHPMITTTPRPSLVFSITSSSDSCADGSSDGQCVQDEDKWIGANCYDESEETQCDEQRRESPRYKAITLPETKHKVYFWRRRIAELFLIQMTLFMSIVMFFQSSNRLSLANATAVSRSRTMTFPSQSNVAALTDNETKIGDAESGSEDCIYVPGGGFSGFWFSLGRLQSIEHPHNETFVCYSAGCLGVVATLLHHGSLLQNGTVDSNMNNDHYHDLYEMARSIQVEWQSGERHRYRVVEAFIDGLLKKLEDLDDDSRALFFDTIISKLNVMTTAFEEDKSISNTDNPQFFLPQSILPRAIVSRPSDISSLKRLLLQSAWIPLATGSSWTHKGHMDGSFSMAQHPKCSRTVGLTEVSATISNESEENSSWLRNQVLLLGNTLNMELSREDVGKLWKIGMNHGV